jgi:hypothetical protein
MVHRGHEYPKAKEPGIGVHRARHSTPTGALLNDANPTRVQKMMRHQHYAMMEIYMEEVQRPLEGAEDASRNRFVIPFPQEALCRP